MSTAPPPYSPSLVDAGTLDTYTIGHRRLIDAIVDGLTSMARDGGARFELIVGPPGSGKTHMLRSVYQRTKASAASAGPRLVMLPERAVVASVADLLARTIESLTASATHDDKALRTAKRADDDDAIELLESRIVELLDGRPLLLFVEHLGQVLEAAGIEKQHSLRATLQRRRNWSVVTTGMRPSSVFTAASAPFFGTFAIRALTPLTSELCHELRALRREGTSPTAATTRACHHLLGGWPRPMVLVQQCSAARPDRDMCALITALCDVLEPELVCAEYRLPHGRGSVFRSIANRARPVSPSDIGDSMFGIDRPAVSAQLKILRKEGLVHALRIGRWSYYELASPTHRLVAARRAQPRRLMNLARFLRSWYADDPDRAELDLGGRCARQPGDALVALDLVTLAGLHREAVSSIVNVLQIGDPRSGDYRRALTKAAHDYAQSPAAERLLLDQCLAGLGREDLLAEHTRNRPRQSV